MPYVIDGNNLLGSWGGPAVAGDGRLTIDLYGAYDADHAVAVAVNGTDAREDLHKVIGY